MSCERVYGSASPPLSPRIVKGKKGHAVHAALNNVTAFGRVVKRGEEEDPSMWRKSTADREASVQPHDTVCSFDGRVNKSDSSHLGHDQAAGKSGLFVTQI